MESLDLKIDVAGAAGLGEDAWIAATVTLPDRARLGPRPVVCFAKPGGGYSRRYYTARLPGPGDGAQADWHAERGWIFVSVDHLGVGESSTHHDGDRLDYSTCVAAAQAAEAEILRRLADGSLAGGFPPIAELLRIGIGQSMGGCLTVVQQGRYHCYDGVAVLGYSAVHTHPPTRPGSGAPITAPWRPRDTLTTSDPMVIVNRPQVEAAARIAGSADSGPPMAWGFHYDDVPQDVVDVDLVDFPVRRGRLPEWGSATLPLAVSTSCLTPGAIAPEAAAIVAPVLVAMGERDVVADPKGEPRAYLSAASVDLFICPRMGHMHNFAGTRELFWQRLESFAAWAGHVKDAGGLL